MNDRHAEQREQKRVKRSKGGRKMVVQGRGYIQAYRDQVAKGATK